MRWSLGRRRPEEKPVALQRSIADPALITLFGGYDPDGVDANVSEYSALTSSALYRAVMLVSGTLASLPLKSYTTDAEGMPKKVTSIFDDPDGPDGQTPFEWMQTASIHRMLYGTAGCLKVKNNAGGLVRLPLVHPLSWSVELPTRDEYAEGKIPKGGKWYKVTFNDGTQKKLDAENFFEIPGPSTDGIFGLGLIRYARQSIATTLQGDKASYKVFKKGALISGLATPKSDPLQGDITDDLPELRRQLNLEVMGTEHAGGIAIVNRMLDFTPWSMTSQQAQFIEARQFSVEDISRFTGVPPHLLMQTEKQTSWGTGVDEQNRGLARYVLNPWAMGFEQRASRLLSSPRWCEFDFAGLERPSADKEIELLLKQTGNKPILTVNEARKIRNLPPVEGGDVLLDSTQNQGASNADSATQQSN
jgi:HK97 family phage portal protein